MNTETISTKIKRNDKNHLEIDIKKKEISVCDGNSDNKESNKVILTDIIFVSGDINLVKEEERSSSKLYIENLSNIYIYIENTNSFKCLNNFYTKEEINSKFNEIPNILVKTEIPDDSEGKDGDFCFIVENN